MVESLAFPSFQNALTTTISDSTYREKGNSNHRITILRKLVPTFTLRSLSHWGIHSLQNLWNKGIRSYHNAKSLLIEVSKLNLGTKGHQSAIDIHSCIMNKNSYKFFDRKEDTDRDNCLSGN
jgi:hypothetical protein